MAARTRNRTASSLRHPARKRIALIAHDHLKPLLVEWVRAHKRELSKHALFATGTTGTRISEALDLPIHCFRSGPLGGDLQIAAKVIDGDIDLIIFFWDPLEAQPHDVDVKALLRTAVLYNIPVATNPASADFFLTSSLIRKPYIASPDPRVRAK